MAGTRRDEETVWQQRGLPTVLTRRPLRRARLLAVTVIIGVFASPWLLPIDPRDPTASGQPEPAVSPELLPPEDRAPGPVSWRGTRLALVGEQPGPRDLYLLRSGRMGRLCARGVDHASVGGRTLVVVQIPTVLRLRADCSGASERIASSQDWGRYALIRCVAVSPSGARVLISVSADGRHPSGVYVYEIAAGTMTWHTHRSACRWLNDDLVLVDDGIEPFAFDIRSSEAHPLARPRSWTGIPAPRGRSSLIPHRRASSVMVEFDAGTGRPGPLVPIDGSEVGLRADPWSPDGSYVLLPVPDDAIGLFTDRGEQLDAIVVSAGAHGSRVTGWLDDRTAYYSDAFRFLTVRIEEGRITHGGERIAAPSGPVWVVSPAPDAIPRARLILDPAAMVEKPLGLVSARMRLPPHWEMRPVDRPLVGGYRTSIDVGPEPWGEEIGLPPVRVGATPDDLNTVVERMERAVGARASCDFDRETDCVTLLRTTEIFGSTTYTVLTFRGYEGRDGYRLIELGGWTLIFIAPSLWPPDPAVEVMLGSLRFVGSEPAA